MRLTLLPLSSLLPSVLLPLTPSHLLPPLLPSLFLHLPSLLPSLFPLFLPSRYDSDNPLAVGDVGMAGVAVDSVEDMKVGC